MGLIQAISIILIVSFLLIVTLKQASITAVHTADTYSQQRAELFLQSAVETAILAIQSKDRSGGDCLQTIHVGDAQFDANIRVLRYYLHANEPNPCTNPAGITKWIQTEESNGMVLLEVIVTPRGKFSDQNLRLYRRTLQRI